MPRIGPLELVLILAVVLIIFGVGKLPQVGKGLGQAIREFNKAKSGGDETGSKEELAKASLSEESADIKAVETKSGDKKGS